MTERSPSAAAPVGALRDRVSGGSSLLVTGLAIVLALLVGAVLIAFSDPDVLAPWGYFFARPTDALTATWQAVGSAYGALFTGAVVDPDAVSAALSGRGTWAQALRPLSESVLAATPLIAGGLAVALPFRAGLFNIGAEGQIIVGAVLGAYLGFAFSLPLVVHLPLAVLGAMLGGALWAGLAGWLKARTGAHEVITTIMLNYIAVYLVAYLLSRPAFQRPGRTDPISPVIAESAQLPPLLGGGLRVHAGILLVLLAAAGTSWLLRRSTLGFRFRAVGANASAARTAGMDVERSYVAVMLLAGALAGLASASQVLGTNQTLTGGVGAGIGFDAITVALLGRAAPLGVVLAGLLFGALSAGSVQMQAATGTPVDVATVVQALIVLFIAAPPLVRAVFRLRGPHRGGVGQTLAKGWNG